MKKKLRLSPEQLERRRQQMIRMNRDPAMIAKRQAAYKNQKKYEFTPEEIERRRQRMIKMNADPRAVAKRLERMREKRAQLEQDPAWKKKVSESISASRKAWFAADGEQARKARGRAKEALQKIHADPKLREEYLAKVRAGVRRAYAEKPAYAEQIRQMNGPRIKAIRARALSNKLQMNDKQRATYKKMLKRGMSTHAAAWEALKS